MRVKAYENETLDAICWRVLSRTDCIEQVIEMNPHTLSQPIVKQDEVIELPEQFLTATSVKETLTLWS